MKLSKKVRAALALLGLSKARIDVIAEKDEDEDEEHVKSKARPAPWYKYPDVLAEHRQQMAKIDPYGRKS